MKKFIALLLITVSIAACSNNKSGNGSGTSDSSITSGNTAARQGQVIPTDSVETSADSTGNIHPGDTTRKK